MLLQVELRTLCEFNVIFAYLLMGLENFLNAFTNMTTTIILQGKKPASEIETSGPNPQG